MDEYDNFNFISIYLNSIKVNGNEQSMKISNKFDHMTVKAIPDH